MTEDLSRRDILTSSAAAAVTAALPSLAPVSSAMAQSIPSSAAEIIAAIRTKKITATAVTKAALERAEQLKDLNTFIFLNKDLALATADYTAAIRLVLASRLGIVDADDHDEDDPRFGIYDWLGYRLHGLVTAIDGD